MLAQPPAPQADDDFLNLLARVRGGDDAAAGELVRRYEKTVLRCVRSRLSRTMRGAMDSMDVMQSVHRSLLIGLKHQRFAFASPQQLIGLAVVMVQRKVARHWRKLKRLPITGSEITGPSAAIALEDLAGEDSPPAEIAMASDLLDRILSQLDDFDRQLVRLRLDGYSSVETASLLAREPAFVRMRWSRLRHVLRELGYSDQ
jgi:RNA polymerase sigma-70 factor (ECF subfamily)